MSATVTRRCSELTDSAGTSTDRTAGRSLASLARRHPAAARGFAFSAARGRRSVVSGKLAIPTRVCTSAGVVLPSSLISTALCLVLISSARARSAVIVIRNLLSGLRNLSKSGRSSLSITPTSDEPRSSTISIALPLRSSGIALSARRLLIPRVSFFMTLMLLSAHPSDIVSLDGAGRQP